MDLLLSNM
jgi:hypothetical protein